MTTTICFITAIKTLVFFRYACEHGLINAKNLQLLSDFFVLAISIY